MIDSKQDEAVKLEACPPHSWAHAPTVGYFRCGKCGERVEHSDPRYAEMISARTTPANLNAPDKQEALAGEGVDQWQPIETAPKGEDPKDINGPPILIWLEGWPTGYEGFWYATDQAWYLANLDGEYGDAIYPTHWRPLPAGPAFGNADALEGTRTLLSNEALAGDDRNGVEGLRDALEELRSRRQQVIDFYEHNGPQWTVGNGREMYDADYVVEAAREDVALVEAALSHTPSSPQADEADVERVGRALYVEFIQHTEARVPREIWGHLARAAIATMTTRPAGGEEVGPWEAMLTLTKAADAAAEWITEARASAEATSSWTTLPYEKGLPQGAQGKREVRNIRAAIRKARAALAPPPQAQVE